MGQHTGGNWFIHGTEHFKDNQLQSLQLPVEYSSWDYKFNIKQLDNNMSDSIF